MNPFKMPLQHLSAIASIGGMLVVMTVYYVRDRTVREISSKAYFKESIDLLKNHEGAKYLLGSPMYPKKFDITDHDNNVFMGQSQKFAVPVKGPDGSGTYYFKLNCNPECVLSSCELEFSKTSKLEPEKYFGKRLVILRDKDVQSH